jgi:hypothetical protein
MGRQLIIKSGNVTPLVQPPWLKPPSKTNHYQSKQSMKYSATHATEQVND